MKIQQKRVDQRRARTKLGRSKYSALMAPHSVLAFTVCAIFFALCSPAAQAQQTKMYRVGILVPGEAWYEIIDGLRVGLKQLGFEEGKQITLAIRDWKGDAKAAEVAAKTFEQEKINLIYATSTNSTITARRATAEIPIVFCAGTDPVAVGLVDSFAKPGEDSQASTSRPPTSPPSAWKFSKIWFRSSTG